MREKNLEKNIYIKYFDIYIKRERGRERRGRERERGKERERGWDRVRQKDPFSLNLKDGCGD